MRKTRMIFAPFLAALLVLGGMLGTAAAQVTFNTSTVAVDVNTDISSVGATTGRTLNLGILGLDNLGNVDIFGEAGGSTIIASVTSVIGTVPVGGGTPGTAAGGNFAAQTSYVTLFQGIGEANVTYPADASGTDSITVRLYERRFDAGGNAFTKLIDTATLQIPVVVATPTAGILNIERFTPAATDPNGAAGTTVLNPATEAADGRVSGGQMTVNQAGGLFLIKAYKINADRTYTFDANSVGSVTITLTGDATQLDPLGANRGSTATVYTATGSMQNGVAEVAVPTGFTKAGVYKVVATLGELGSVSKKVTDDAQTQDQISLVPEALPAKVGLSSNLSVISNTAAANVAQAAAVDGVTYDPTFTATLVDTFGNKIVAGTSPGGAVKVTDVNAKVPEFTITIAAAANSASLLVDGSVATAGLASLTGAIPLNPLITPSDPLSLTIRQGTNQLVIGAAPGANIWNLPVAAGASFVFTNIAGIGLNPAAPNLTILLPSDQIKITNQTAQANGTRESITVAITDAGTGATPPLPLGVDSVLGLFTKTTSEANVEANGFKVEDPSGSYAGLFTAPATNDTLAFTFGSPSQAFIKDKAGRVVDTIPATVLANGTFQVIINGARVSMTDSFGNTNNQGTLTLTSTKGTTVGTITVGNAGTQAVITYPAGTTGEDTPTLAFSQPGITPPALKITFPVVSTLASFETFPAGPVGTPIQLGVNGVTPLTVFPRTASGATITVADGYFVDYDTVGLAVFTTGGAAIVSGANVGAPKGRFVMQVFAKTTPGDYKLTIRDVGGTITQEVNFKVVKFTLPLTVSSQNVVLDLGTPEDLTISGGQPPYVAASGNTAIVTASVSGATLTLTPVALGGPVTVTVTDGISNPVTVSVTVKTPIGKVVGGDPGIVNEDAAAALPLTLRLNVTDNGVNPPTGVVQEWLVFGAIVNGVQTPFFFFPDPPGAIVPLTSTTDPAAVEYTFNHTSPVQTLTTNFPLSALGLKAGDTFFYLYAWSPTTVTSFSNAPDLKFNNIVLISVK